MTCFRPVTRHYSCERLVRTYLSTPVELADRVGRGYAARDTSHAGGKVLVVDDLDANVQGLKGLLAF